MARLAGCQTAPKGPVGVGSDRLLEEPYPNVSVAVVRCAVGAENDFGVAISRANIVSCVAGVEGVLAWRAVRRPIPHGRVLSVLGAPRKNLCRRMNEHVS